MVEKNGFRRQDRQRASTHPATTPPTAPSSRSEHSTASQELLLFEWWLIKSDTDAGGKMLAVAGFNAQGRDAVTMFTSAPIVKRLDAFTVEAADGTYLRLQGGINESLTSRNGIPPEVSRHFSVGFPWNWDSYAHGGFENNHPSSTMPACSPGINTGSEISSRLDAFLDIVRPMYHALLDGNRSSCAPQMPGDICSVNPTLVSSKRREAGKSNQNHMISVGCGDISRHDARELENDTNLAEPVAPVDHLPNDKEDESNAEITTNAIDSKEQGQQHNQSAKWAVKSQNRADNSKEHCMCALVDLAPRKNSDGMDSFSLAAKMSLPLEASFESPPYRAQRNADNGSTSNTAGLAAKIGSDISLPNLSRILSPKYGKRLQDYMQRSGNRAQRIRVDNAGDSEVIEKIPTESKLIVQRPIQTRSMKLASDEEKTK